jgi:probable rRNA maturation factor
MSPTGSAKSKPAGLEVLVTVRHPRLKGAETAVRALQTLHAMRHGFGEARLRASLSLVFMTDGELAELHGRFLADPSPTDVITFPSEDSFGSVGEICVSVDAALRQPRRDFSAELALYVVHGWLHLAGHDDMEPAKKRQMRRAEQKALAALRSAGALPRFTLGRTSR